MKRLAVAALGLGVCVACHSMSRHDDKSAVAAQAATVVMGERDVASMGAAELPVTTNYIEQINSAGHLQPVPLLQAKDRMKVIFDLVRSHPNEMFHELRVKQPIFKSPGATSKLLGKSIPNIYIVTKYDDVTEVLNAHETFTVDPYKKVMDPTLDPRAGFGGFMLDRESSPANIEKHVMKHVLSVDDLARVRQIVSLLARQSIEAGTSKDGKLDIVASVTRAVPIGLNGEYFGFPGPSFDKMAQWSRDSQYAFFHNPFQDKAKIKASIDSGAQMRDYVQNVLVPDRSRELKNGRPAYDPLSRLLMAAKQHTEYGLDMNRIVTDTMGLLVGSVETTNAAITQSLEILMAHPTLFEGAVKAARDGEDQLVAAYVWEALRFKPVNPWLARYSKTAMVIAKGTPRETLIPAGSLVLASTQSAMHDPDVFADPEHFHLDRDQKMYMHLGYGYHRCLGDDVSLVMVPETAKQLLLLPNLRITDSPVANMKPGKDNNKEEWVFPENWVLQYDVAAQPPMKEKFEGTMDTVYGFLGLGKYMVGRIQAMPNSRAVLKAIGAVVTDKGQAKQQAMDALPPLFVQSTVGETKQDVENACLYDNPKSISVFPNVTDRKNYCAVRLDFRGCYFVERIIGKRTSQDTYNHCVYGLQLMTPVEQADFKNKFAHLDMFSFLNYEQ